MAQARILIIDDDPDITEAMRVVLENRDFQVDSALDSVAGMEKIKAHRPDVIILDVMMNTSQEGFNLSRELKENDQTRDIPILMLTAVKDKTGFDFKAAAGDDTWLPVEAYLDKPVKPDVLLQTIDGLLQKS
jgi:CheY-like chemotaxis protein